MEQASFTEIAVSLRHRILDVAHGYRLGGDNAEDVAQDAMLKLWSIRDDLKNEKHAIALAVTMAKNLSIDRLRRKTESGLEHVNPTGDRFQQPDFVLENNENEQWLQERLKRLPTKEYAVLHLRQVEKKTTEEIAAIVGIRQVSVATLLARARKKLLDDIKRRTL